MSLCNDHKSADSAQQENAQIITRPISSGSGYETRFLRILLKVLGNVAVGIVHGLLDDSPPPSLYHSLFLIPSVFVPCVCVQQRTTGQSPRPQPTSGLPPTLVTTLSRRRQLTPVMTPLSLSLHHTAHCILHLLYT